MIKVTRNWLRRNRTNIAIGAGLLGAGYLAAQYVLSKVRETRERLGDDRIAREKSVKAVVARQIADVAILKSAAPLRAKSGRLLVHCISSSTYGDRKHP